MTDLNEYFGNLNLGDDYDESSSEDDDGSYIPAYPNVDPTEHGWEYQGYSGLNSVAPCLKYTKECRMKNKKHGKRLVVLKVWPTTGTVMTYMDHPTKGRNCLYRHGDDMDESLFIRVLNNPRVHTNFGYHTRSEREIRRLKREAAEAEAEAEA